ncbi:GGDEF domain-containing protein [Paenibacillus sp. TRM 82003]|nr:GGDEF domain-containing protein [Paenibacillus sp. TRM 82003]
MSGKIAYDSNTLLYRDILRSCWLVIALYIVGTSTQLFFTEHDRTAFFWQAMVYPSCGLIALTGLLEAAFRKRFKWMDYLLVGGVNGLACIIILSLYELKYGMFALIFPILLSLHFYNRRLIGFALAQALVTVAVVQRWLTGIGVAQSLSDFTFLVALLITTAYVMNGLRKHAFTLSRELVAVTKEKQDLQTKNTLMEALQRIEPVTGLYNHRAFHERLASMAEEDAASGSVQLAILDIDNFKRVNDTFGHAAGDAVIQFVANQLKEHLESGDFGFRYGGEEFAVLYVGKSTERVVRQLETIRRAVSAQPHEALGGDRVTVSIGVRELEPGLSKEALFHEADMALYEAKRTGKDRTIVYSGRVSV